MDRASSANKVRRCSANLYTGESHLVDEWDPRETTGQRVAVAE